jgi:hypothetical protein
MSFYYLSKQEGASPVKKIYEELLTEIKKGLPLFLTTISKLFFFILRPLLF